MTEKGASRLRTAREDGRIIPSLGRGDLGFRFEPLMLTSEMGLVQLIVAGPARPAALTG